MPYILYKSNGTPLATIADGSLNASSTSLTFVGKNYAGYGQILNQDILKLLENFSNTTSPNNPITGQLWYDSVNRRLTVYDGTQFKPLSNISSGSVTPNDNSKGDFWFNDTEQKLYFYNGSKFLAIGPETSTFSGTKINSALVTDVNNISHYVLEFTVTDDTGIPRIIAVASKDEISSVSPTDPLYTQNFTTLKQGLTLPTSDPVNGNSISNLNEGAYYFWGTAANARGLVYATNAGIPAVFHQAEDFFLYADYINALANGLKINNDFGLYLGGGYDFHFHYSGSGAHIGQITNLTGNKIAFAVGDLANTSTNVLTIDGQSLVPGKGVTGDSGNSIAVSYFDLGQSTNGFANLYVNTVTSTVINVTTMTGTDLLLTDSFTTLNAYVTNQTSTNIISTNVLSILSTTTNLTVANDATVGNNLSITGNANVQGNIILTGANSTLQGNISGNVSGNISASAVTATNVYANSINVTSQVITSGTVVTANLVAYGGGYASPGIITGAWSLAGSSTMAATYADLAERYHADATYDYGTVLVVGGTKEVTATTTRAAVNVAGVVSERPAFKMNQTAGNDTTHPYIALKGRLPCKVVGIIHKGDRLVTSSRSGYAEAFQEGDSENAVIGIALEDNLSDTGKIEIKV